MDIDFFSMTGLLLLAAYIFAGIVDSVCGGGGLISIPALLSVGIPVHSVVGTNLCTLVPGTWAAIVEYGKAGKINYKIAKTATPFAIVGTLIGGKLNLLLDEHYLQIVMIALLPFLAAFSLFKKNVGAEDHSSELSDKQIAIGAALIGFGVAVYHGFYGPASGLFYLIAFASVLRIDAVTANGVARFIFGFTNIAIAILFGVTGNLVWDTVIIGMIGYTIGNIVGSKLAIRNGAKIIRPLYYCVLVGLMIKLITSL